MEVSSDRFSSRADGVNVQYFQADGAATGRCAVLVHGKERSLIASLAAAEKYDLKNPETKQAVDSGQFWKDLKKLHQ